MRGGETGGNGRKESGMRKRGRLGFCAFYTFLRLNRRGDLIAAGDADFDGEGGVDVVEFAVEGAGDGGKGFGVAADGDGDVLGAHDGASGGVEAFPAGAGEKDLGPGVGGAEGGGNVCGGGVAADEAGGQAEEAAGLDEQGREVAAGTAAVLEGAGRALHAGFLAGGVDEVAGDGAVHLVDEGVGFDELAGAPELVDPSGDGGLVVEVGRDEVGAEFDAFAREKEEGEVYRAGFDDKIEGLVIVVFHSHVAADDELGDRGGVEVGDGDGVVVHVARPGEFGGRGVDHEGAADDADVVTGAGAEEQAMVGQGHRTGVAVVGEVMDEQSVHGKREERSSGRLRAARRNTNGQCGTRALGWRELGRGR